MSGRGLTITTSPKCPNSACGGYCHAGLEGSRRVWACLSCGRVWNDGEVTIPDNAPAPVPVKYESAGTFTTIEFELRCDTQKPPAPISLHPAALGIGPLTMADKASHKAFQARVVTLAKAYGWLCYHTLDSRGSEEGYPDLVISRYGLTIYAELKVGADKLKAKQRHWLELLASAGHPAYHWRPEHWPKILAILTGGQYGHIEEA